MLKTVRGSEEVDLGLLRLPPPRREVTLLGQVVAKDGKPVPKVSVRVESVPRGLYVDYAKTDAAGKFSIAVQAGFLVRVRLGEGSRRDDLTDLVVTTSEDAEPLRLLWSPPSQPPGER
jgi:hypothetical protein